MYIAIFFTSMNSLGRTYGTVRYICIIVMLKAPSQNLIISVSKSLQYVNCLDRYLSQQRGQVTMAQPNQAFTVPVSGARFVFACGWV
jgi:hypothetical protein